MEIDECSKSSPKCYKCNLPALGALNINYNASSSTFILWNKYEIYVYENFMFQSVSKVLLPDFPIYQLISCNNLIMCLDFTGNIHTTPMKFKNATQKRIKCVFLPREQCVLGCTLYTAEEVICLKLEEDTYYLSLHYLNADFELQKKVKLTILDDSQYYKNSQNHYILKCYTVPIEQYANITKIFNFKQTVWKDYTLIIVTFDKRIIYGCIFSLKSPTEELSLLKLLTCPSEICDIKVVELDHLCILISLTAGSLIQLVLNDNCPTSIVHLNTAISKCVPTNDTIIYTDGITMWKSENTFNDNINFQQFIVKQVKDFVLFADKIICSTFTNLIYLLTYDDDASYIKASKDEYCEAGIILNDSGYLFKILEHVEKTNELEKKINEECNYITALSLSNRPDILDNVFQYSVIVYENYKDVIKENIDLALTDNIKDYFEANLFYFLIKIQLASEKHKMSNVMLQVFKDLQIHITLMSMHKVLKTTSLRVFEELKGINILVPLNGKIINSNVRVKMKIIKGIPGALNKEQTLWHTLHNKEIVLNAEHFIKTNNEKQNIIELKKSESSLEEQIYQIAYNCNKNLFKFCNVLNKKFFKTWSFFVKLPDNYEEAFKNEKFYKEIFNHEKAMSLLKKSTSEDFIKTGNDITFEIGTDKVILEIINDGFSKVNALKVTSENMKIGFDMRNFYSNLVYNNFKNYEPGKEFVRYTMYTTIENFQKRVRELIIDQYDNGNMKDVMEQFQRDVIGAMSL